MREPYLCNLEDFLNSSRYFGANSITWDECYKAFSARSGSITAELGSYERFQESCSLKRNFKKIAALDG